MGRVLSQFTVGETFRPHGRTITEVDIAGFAGLTGDWNPVHTDQTVAEPLFGGRIAHGPFFPGLAFGMLTQFDLIDGTAIALRDISWSFTAPVRLGDTVRLRAEVVSVSPHPSRPDRGRVGFSMIFINQNDETVSQGTATVVVHTERGAPDHG